MPITPEDRPALELSSVTRRFRAAGRTVAAVDALSARVERGAVTGLVGPDGAGKTTLMRLCTGLLLPDEGRIELFGIDVARRPEEARARLAYMPQRFGLYEDLSVLENLDLYARLQGVPAIQHAARFEELLHMTGLGPFLGRLAGRLSGGMKQKLGLACTLVQVPEMLFLDEPTVGVDPVSRRELWAIVDALVRTSGVTVLLSTSYLDEAERCASVLLMHEGRLLESAAPAALTAPMTGRCFRASAPGTDTRRLHERLARSPGILDATIQGGHVRLVTRAAGLPPPPRIPDAGNLTIEPVAPRLEDAFVARLLEQAADAWPGSPPSPSPSPFPSPSPASAATATATATAREPAADVVISADRLTRRFGDFTAVDAVSFEVRRGEIFGLLGANGAGKSTTFRMLCGLLPPTAGALRVAGFDLRRAAGAARGRIGYMAQRFSLYGDLSPRQNLTFFSSAYRLRGAHQQERIGWALREFGLQPMADAASRDLPLGYKQRLALACALMHEPDILFLDEPTSGVDPLARREFWRRIHALAGRGVTVLVTTHFMEEAEYCDRLIILSQGGIIAAGDSERLKSLARGAQLPNPTMEDAFIAVLEGAAGARAA